MFFSQTQKLYIIEYNSALHDSIYTKLHDVMCDVSPALFLCHLCVRIHTWSEHYLLVTQCKAFYV